MKSYQKEMGRPETGVAGVQRLLREAKEAAEKKDKAAAEKDSFGGDGSLLTPPGDNFLGRRGATGDSSQSPWTGAAVAHGWNEAAAKRRRLATTYQTCEEITDACECAANRIIRAGVLCSWGYRCFYPATSSFPSHDVVDRAHRI